MTHFDFPPPGKQLYVAGYLDRIRLTGLLDAVRSAAAQVPAATLRAEMLKHAPASGLQLAQTTNVRDEHVFLTPTLLRTAPGTFTYYRLLLGISRKQFYTGATGLRPFEAMEDQQEIRARAEPLIDDLCTEMNEAMYVLLTSLPRGTLARDVVELPFLTLGSQADGSWRTQIGTAATTDVFEAMKAVVKNQGRSYVETESTITMTNSAGREVTLALAPDPDVVIRETVNGQDVYKVAIEIKGGGDYSNVHNRAGEAEKSHQKARAAGAQDCWTIISLQNADVGRLRQESPTTREWLDVEQVRSQNGQLWDRLVALTISAMGI